MALPALLPSIFLATLSATSFVLLPIPGRAATVLVNGVNHNITTYAGSYSDDPGLFGLPPSGRMPWWGDPDLAEEFAFAIGSSLPGNGGQGPYFAFAEDTDVVTAVVLALNLPGSSSEVDIGKEESVVYAVVSAQPQPTGVPAPLPLFGVGAAFAWSRRLRARQRGRAHGGSSPRPSASTSAN
jgi:MYXO-CTERM domain-containing protein